MVLRLQRVFRILWDFLFFVGVPQTCFLTHSQIFAQTRCDTEPTRFSRITQLTFVLNASYRMSVSVLVLRVWIHHIHQKRHYQISERSSRQMLSNSTQFHTSGLLGSVLNQTERNPLININHTMGTTDSGIVRTLSSVLLLQPGFPCTITIGQITL